MTDLLSTNVLHTNSVLLSQSLGVCTLEVFFRFSLFKEATCRLSLFKEAIFRQERIVIFGDYDVDGILSVVILTRALETLGATVDYFIPERLKEGYGLKEKHVDMVLEKKADLVISVDCGIKAHPFVRKAKENSVDVIITDHHQPGQRLPEALAILNPVMKESGYPDKNLAGIGVVFKLIQALFESEGKKGIHSRGY